MPCHKDTVVNGFCVSGQHEHFRIFSICTRTSVVVTRSTFGWVWCLKLHQNMSPASRYKTLLCDCCGSCSIWHITVS